MKPFIKTLKLLGVSTLGSIGFAIIAGGITAAEDPQEALGLAVIILPLAIGIEVWVYKRFLKDWRDVLMNYAISHFAGFFALFGVMIGNFLELNDEGLFVSWLLIWFPVAYLGQYHIIYVERLEAKVEKQQQEIKGFEKKRLQLTRQMTSLRGRVENQKRWTDQNQKPNQ